MKKEIRYWPSDFSKHFGTEEECLAYEKKEEERKKYWEENSPKSKYNELLVKLEKAFVISEDTIATCTFDSLKIKGLVTVCQEFVEKNKEYLKYY